MKGIIITIVTVLLLTIISTILLSKNIKEDKTKRITIFVLSLLTIVCHYSSLLYHAIGHAVNPDKVTTVAAFLRSNPNLVIPIYPCNMVMWCCLILGILAICKKTNNKVFRALIDYCFLFGTISAIAGMVANGDYFVESVPKNYDIYKSAVAHGFMLVNVLVLPCFGFFKLDAIRNIIRTTIMTIIMGLDGLFCSLLIYFYGGASLVPSWNAMFLFRSPFEGLGFVRFYTVMPIFLVLLFGVLAIFEVIKYPKDQRFKKKLFTNK